VSALWRSANQILELVCLQAGNGAPGMRREAECTDRQASSRQALSLSFFFYFSLSQKCPTSLHWGENYLTGPQPEDPPAPAASLIYLIVYLCPCLSMPWHLLSASYNTCTHTHRHTPRNEHTPSGSLKKAFKSPKSFLKQGVKPT